MNRQRYLFSNVPARSSGLSLVELLIAMVLSLSLAAVVIEVYIGSAALINERDARLRMQENARFVLDLLTSELRMAGHFGCFSTMDSLSMNDMLNHPVDSTMQPRFGIQGWEAAATAPGDINNSRRNVATLASTEAEWTAAQFAGFNLPVVQAVPDSDMVRWWGSVGNPAAVINIDNRQRNGPVVTVTSHAAIAEDDFLLISDCEQADIAQVCQVNAQGMVTTLALGGGCTMGNTAGVHLSARARDSNGNAAEMMRLQGALYYVGKRGNAAGNPPALFRATLGADGRIAAPEELAAGVESMQLLYGVDSDRQRPVTVDAWLTADQVADWHDVLAVRISLLLQSVAAAIVPAPQPYVFNGVTYNGTGSNGALPEDKRIRRVFHTTVGLRNRLSGS